MMKTFRQLIAEANGEWTGEHDPVVQKLIKSGQTSLTGRGTDKNDFGDEKWAQTLARFTKTYAGKLSPADVKSVTTELSSLTAKYKELRSKLIAHLKANSEKMEKGRSARRKIRMGYGAELSSQALIDAVAKLKA